MIVVDIVAIFMLACMFLFVVWAIIIFIEYEWERYDYRKECKRIDDYNNPPRRKH